MVVCIIITQALSRKRNKPYLLDNIQNPVLFVVLFLLIFIDSLIHKNQQTSDCFVKNGI